VLVIVLAVIVIASLAGIYFLLRHGEPSPADRAARRRKYSIRRRGVRTHPLPIGLPGSFSEKIGSMFKGRRSGAGWVPARDIDDDDDDDGKDDGDNGGYRVGANVWDSTDEPLRERGLDAGDEYQYQYPRVGSTPASRLTVEANAASTHRSREATHVDAAGAESSARLLGSTSTAASASPAPATQAPVLALAPALVQREVPDEAWHNADGTRSGVGGGSADSSHAASSLGYYAPQPRRADSGYEIPLFAGSTPFRQDTDT